MSLPPARIAPVRTPEDLAATIALFRAYAASLDIDLCFQGFEDELATMPGKYAPPAGELLLARNAAGEPAGCIALRPLAEPGLCEMKRLYVAPAGRGLGLGRRLAEAIVAEARRIGYRRMVLDTLPSMVAARALYASLGFAETTPYYATPLTGTLFLALELGR